MEVLVVDAGRLAPQTRGVEVRDVVDLGVEQVQGLDLEARSGVHFEELARRDSMHDLDLDRRGIARTDDGAPD